MTLLHGLFFLLLVLALGFGGILLNSKLTRQMHTQLQLDRCVARTAVQTKTALDHIGKLNLAIVTARNAAKKTPHPLARAGIIAGISALVTAQEIERRRFTVLQILFLKCGGLFGTPVELPLRRLPPDSAGPQPLHWMKIPIPEIVLQARKLRRSSSATLWNSMAEDLYGFASWKERWSRKPHHRRPIALQ